MTKTNSFTRIFKLPPAMHPYLNLIVTEQEIDLVVGLEDHPLSGEEIAEMLSIPQDEADHLIRNAWKRDIIDRVLDNDKIKYTPDSFYANLDYLSAYESGTWRKLPEKIKAHVAEWQVKEFIALWKPAIEEAARNPDSWMHIKNRDILLLEEALEMAEASDYFCLLPCQCKTTLCPNSPRIEGSMRLGERARLTLEQGQGTCLTVEHAKAHLINLDRMGLVHTGPRQWRRFDPDLEWVSHGNCHPSYSFPFLAGLRLGLNKLYPRVHYQAVLDWGKCTHCGLCIARCPFDAFFQDGSEILLHGESLRQVCYDEENCWGCGLCIDSCSESAIKLTSID